MTGNEQTNNGKEKTRQGVQLKKPMRQAVLNFVSSKYLEGNSYRTIAKQVEEQLNQPITFVSIGRMVNQLIGEWKTERIGKLDDLKTVELGRINKLEQTYWEGWSRSLTATERKTEKQRAVPGTATDGSKTMNPVSAEKSTFIEETFGDPRFLAGIQWCISMRCKILGIEAPIEINAKMTSTVRTKTSFHTRKRERP